MPRPVAISSTPWARNHQGRPSWPSLPVMITFTQTTSASTNSAPRSCWQQRFHAAQFARKPGDGDGLVAPEQGGSQVLLHRPLAL